MCGELYDTIKDVETDMVHVWEDKASIGVFRCVKTAKKSTTLQAQCQQSNHHGTSCRTPNCVSGLMISCGTTLQMTKVLGKATLCLPVMHISPIHR